MAASVIAVCCQREAADCGIAALAMLLGVSYEDVLRCTAITDRQQGRKGLWTRTLRRVAARLGHQLVTRRVFDLDDAYGLLRMPDHAVVLRNGLVINTDGTIWEASDFLSHLGVRQEDCLLLVTAE